jgi:hypothetical protein
VLPWSIPNFIFLRESLYTFSTVSTVCVIGGGAGVDSAWELKKLEARKMLVNRAESPPSTAPMMIANDHFIQEDEDLRPENALLARY